MRKNANRKLLQLLCGLLCAALIFAAAPRAAAEDDDEDAGPLVIEDYNDGNSWNYNAETSTYTVDGYIEVTGRNGSTRPLTFVLADYSTVIWLTDWVYWEDEENASPVTLLDIQGEGAFELYECAISLGHPGTSLRTESGIDLYLCNVEINAYPDYGYAVAIDAGGSLRMEEECDIWSESPDGSTTIVAGGDVIIKESKVVGDNTEPGNLTLRSNEAIDIIIEVSELKGSEGVIMAPLATVDVSDSTIAASGLLRYAGGSLYGNAIMADTVDVRDSCVSAYNGAAILYSTEVNLDRSFVFGYGVGVGGGAFKIDAEGDEIAAPLNVIFQMEDMTFAIGGEYEDENENPEVYVEEREDVLIVAFDHDKYDEDKTLEMEEYLSDLREGDVERTLTMAKRSGTITYRIGAAEERYVSIGLYGKPIWPNPKGEPIEDEEPDEDEGDDPTDDPGDTNPPNDTTPVPITPRPPLVVESEPDPTPAAAPKERAKPRPLPPLPEPATVPITVPATEPTAPTTEPTTAPSTEPVVGPSTPTGGDSGSSSGTTSPGTTAPASRPPAAGGQQQTTEPSAEPTEPTTEPSTEPTEPAPQGVTAQAPTTTVPAATEPIVTPTAPVNPQDIAPPPEEKTGLAAAVPAIIGGGAVVTAGAGVAWVFKGWRKP